MENPDKINKWRFLTLYNAAKLYSKNMKSIEKAVTGWRATARVRCNGKIINRQITGFKTREEAKEALEQLKKQIRAGKREDFNTTRHPKYFKAVVAIYEDKRGPFSRSHAASIERLKADLGESETIQFPDRFEQYVAGFRAKGKNHQANRFIEIVRSAYQACVLLEYFTVNPISKARFPASKEEPRDNYYPPEVMRDLILSIARNPRRCHIARAVQYYYSVPSRKNEIVKMVIGDIDLFGRRVRVHNGTTKNDVGIWKPIPPAMMIFFKRRVREANDLNEPVFCRIVGGSRKDRTKAEPRIVPIGDFKTAFNAARVDAGLPGLRVHDFRHISATDLTNNGTPERIVMSVAGWKTNMLRSYYHMANDGSSDLIKWPEKPKQQTSQAKFVHTL